MSHDEDRTDPLARWIDEQPTSSEVAEDARVRRLTELLEAAQSQEPPSMNDDEANRVLEQVHERARKTSARAAVWWRRRTTWMGLGAAAALTVVAILVPRRDKSTPPAVTSPFPGERVGRETLLRTEVDGRTVLIHAVAYETEN